MRPKKFSDQSVLRLLALKTRNKLFVYELHVYSERKTVLLEAVINVINFSALEFLFFLYYDLLDIAVIYFIYGEV